MSLVKLFFYTPWNSNSHELPIGFVQYESGAVIINDGLISSHYAHICKSGVITHLTCDYVLGFDGIYYGIEENYNVVELIVTDLYRLLGDADLHPDGIVVTVGPGICAVQSLDTILFVFRGRNEFFDDVILYVQ
ncbi:6222_t:CDS:2, partial [Gigaspora rosea]